MRRSASSEEGDKALFRFVSACLERGLMIATPLPHAGYDLVVHNPETNDMWRVQVKLAGRLRNKYWVGSTHRKRGARYARELVQRFVFAKPDGSGFWIVDGKTLEGKAGMGLNEQDHYWERWQLFSSRI